MSCLRIVRHSQITSLVVVDDDDKPIGLLRLLDAPGAAPPPGGQVRPRLVTGGNSYRGRNRRVRPTPCYSEFAVILRE